MFCGKQVFVAAEEFPNQSLDTIAENGITCFFGYGNPQSSDLFRVAAGYNGKES